VFQFPAVKRVVFFTTTQIGTGVYPACYSVRIVGLYLWVK